MQVSSLMWDYDHNSLPSELTNNFAKISSIHNHRTRAVSHGNLYCKIVKTTNYGIKSFGYQGAKIFNELIKKDYFKLSKSKKSFLYNLKREILSAY